MLLLQDDFSLSLLITGNFLPIYILVHWIASNNNFFLCRWAICRLSFNQVTTITVVSMYCCFILLFRRGRLYIGFVISVISCDIGINSMIRVVFIYFRVYDTFFIMDWVSWITRQHLWLSKFELCFSKKSFKFCLLIRHFSKCYFQFLKMLFSISRVLTFCFSTHISSFSLESRFSVKRLSCNTFNSFFKSYTSSKRYESHLEKLIED